MCSFCNHKTVESCEEDFLNPEYIISIMSKNILSVHKTKEFPQSKATFKIDYCPYCGKKIKE